MTPEWAGLAVTESATGVRLAAWVTPGAAKTALKGCHDGALKLLVRSPPEKGKANQEVVEFLAERLAVARKQVRVVAGLQSRRKTLEIAGLTAADLMARLETTGPA
jgi:uncharacterized protein (TIGR00251 family)